MPCTLPANGVLCRLPSGWPADSTLITCAPKSARWRTADGPAIVLDMSITRVPASGRLGSSCGNDISRFLRATGRDAPTSVREADPAQAHPLQRSPEPGLLALISHNGRCEEPPTTLKQRR